MAIQVNSLTYNGKTYSVGDIVSVNTTTFAGDIGGSYTNTISGATNWKWKITSLWQSDANTTANYPVGLQYYSGGGFGNGYVKLANLTSGGSTGTGGNSSSGSGTSSSVSGSGIGVIYGPWAGPDANHQFRQCIEIKCIETGTSGWHMNARYWVEVVNKSNTSTWATAYCTYSSSYVNLAGTATVNATGWVDWGWIAWGATDTYGPETYYYSTNNTRYASKASGSYTVPGCMPGTVSDQAWDTRNNAAVSAGGWFEAAKLTWSGFTMPNSSVSVSKYQIYYRQSSDNSTWSGWGLAIDNIGKSTLTATVGSVNDTTASSNWGDRGLYFQWSVVAILSNGSNSGVGNCTTGVYRKCNAYAQTFNANGGSGAPTTIYKFTNYDVVMPTTKPTRANYNFKGWTTNSAGTGTVYTAGTRYTGWANQTNAFYAKWELKKYTISYNANGGTGAPSAQTKTHGTALTLSSTKPTKSTVTDATYTVTYNANGGSCSTASATAKKTTSYTFKNWNTASGGAGTAYNAGASYTANADATLYAQYNSSTSTESVILPTATKSGYTFIGWSTSVSSTSNGLTGSYTPTGNVTLYANWKKTITVTYNANGGSGAPSAQSQTIYNATTSASITLSSTTPTRTGYTFQGWGTSASDTSVDYKAGTAYSFTANTTIYAIWTANTNTKYVVNHFQMNTSGSYPTSATESENKTGTTAASLTLANLAKSYTGFTYDYGQVNGSTVTTTTILADGSRVINLYYKRNQYTVTLTKGTGIASVSGAGTYYYNASVTINATLSTGYSWSKWSGTHSTTTQKYTFNMPASNVSDTANATTIGYKITYDEAGGSAVSDLNYNITTTNVTLAAAPTRIGYTFGGWKLASAVGNWSAKTYSASENVGTGKYGNITLVAQWSIVGYKITYDENGGSAVNDLSYNITTNVTLATAPTKTGYSFGGWKLASAVGNWEANTYTTGQNIGTGKYGDITLVAQWTAISSTVTFNANGGSVSTTTKSVTYDSTYGDLPTPTRTGYTFNGWFTATSGGSQITSNTKVTITAAQTLYARWTAITYSIKYNGNGSTSGSMSNSSHTYDTAKALTSNAYVRKYTVTYNYNGSGASNTTATATSTFNKWYLNSSGTGTGYSDGANVKNLSSTQDEIVNLFANWTLGSVKPPSPTRSGWTLLGWSTTKSATSAAITTSYTPTADTTLYAIWEKNIVLSYNMNSGSGSISAQSQKIYNTTANHTFTISSTKPTKTGYTFQGWSTNKNATSASYQPGGTITLTNSTTLYAIWTKEITITYNANGGTASSVPTASKGTLYNGNSTTSVTLSSTQPTRENGYTFQGWNTSSSAQSGYAAGSTQSFSGDTTLYAIWKKTITVKFSVNGGSSTTPSDITVSFYNTTTSASIKMPAAPTRSGYTFLGWGTSNTAHSATYSAETSYNLSNSVTLYAIWRKTITITYNVNGGTGTFEASTGYLYNADTSVAITLHTTAPTRANGYSFKGWGTASTSQSGYAAGSTQSFSSNTTLYATWEKSITLTYDANGGTGTLPSPETKKIYNSTTDYTFTTTSVIPTKTGYTFIGWSINNAAHSATYVSGNPIKISNSTTLYAIWSKEITITYNINGGTSTAPESSKGTLYNAETSTKIKITATKPTKTGYTFKGWGTSTTDTSVNYTSDTEYSFSANTTVYAIWAKTIVIGFNANGGSGAPDSLSQTVYNATTSANFTLPTATPSYSGWTFKGWSTSATAQSGYAAGSTQTFSSSTTLYATWARTITITYDVNTGSGTVSSSSVTVYNGAKKGSITISSTEPTKTGYTFLGWSTSSTATSATYASGTSYDFTSSIKLYAVWKINKYTASFNANGGNTANPASITVNYNTALGTLPTTSRTGYTFAGWWTAASGGSQINTSTKMGASNITYYAHWTANPYTVEFNGNGSTSGTMSNQSFTYDVEQALTANAYSRSHTITYKYNDNKTPDSTETKAATFAGWATSSSGSVAYTDKKVVKNLATSGTKTLYAIWTLGTVTLPSPSRTGYTFNGWYDAASGGNKIGDAGATYTVSTTKTLHAQWTAHTYTVTYDGNGATSGSTASSSHIYDVAKQLTANGYSKTGYTFVGWNTSSTATTATYTDKKSVTNLTATQGGTVKLYAIWSKSISLIYNNNGGSGGPGTDKKTVYNSTTSATFTISSTVPTRSTYTFIGWGNSNSLTAADYVAGNTLTLSSNKTIYALWKKTITVIYNANGGSGAPSAQSTTIYNSTTGASFTLGAAPVRAGYTFKGWSTSSSATSGDAAGSTKVFENNVTLYATWSINTYTIEYDLANGTLDGDNPTSYKVTTSTFTLNNPTREYYDFVGWTGSNGTTPQITVTIPKGSTGNKSYTANWKLSVTGGYAQNNTWKYGVWYIYSNADKQWHAVVPYKAPFNS